ncbi:nicotinamide mononucleotide transporter [Steroidobacter sp. S1-65]|uniref:Nicotinamide riboside transporter PnuC n=1 Tax=Steroidobacter gossypii TaxID=2805490 RepID=A0ABS1WQF7_9GAMM|nr:nicotinamide riboside transporter PnuC [Steroidobacter gossypii]MBM0103209.1 nicotinamide mononucleotide transporter [Steroidobacter gossypii]
MEEAVLNTALAPASMWQTVVEQFLATSPWEAAASLLGLAYLLLAVRRNLLCWLCAFVSTSIYIALFVKASLYMQVVLNVFYLVMAVYGFIDWKRGRTESGDVRIESWSVNQHVTVAVLVIIASALNGWALSRWTDSPAPFLDSFVTWGSIVTTWMVARRIIENWLYWIVVDAAAAWLYFSQGLLATTILFIIYLGIVVRGYFVWRREQVLQTKSAIAAPSI